MKMIDTIYHWMLLIVIVASVLTQTSVAEYQIKRFEYKHSFKGPNLVTAKGTIPFWNIAGGMFNKYSSLFYFEYWIGYQMMEQYRPR